MGVTNLWQVLVPVQQNKPMSALAGKTIAVDLSIWVCENQCVKQMQGVVTRPYLRNLYFRVNCLIQLGINLIFAVEGDAPDLKRETMNKRQEVQYPGKRRGPPKGPPKRKQVRSQFNAKLRECCEMLDYLGVPYIQSMGEAEALCGLLNAAGIVDGCITNDGDVFLYGAKTVYRNFSINSKDPHIEEYSMIDIQEKLGLDREKMVALALLVGCDYVPKGVPGVGIERATKLLASYSSISPLMRFKVWKKLSDKDCFDSIELQIKRKADSVTDFPQKRVIDEFLVPKDPLPSRTMVWKRPKLVQLQVFSAGKLEWPEEYTQDKVVPLITLWDMQDIIKGGNAGHLAPFRIVKSRVRHGTPSYEVEWHKQSDDRFCQTDYYVTIEDRELFSNCFPDLVKQFEDDVAQKKSKTKGRKKKAQDIETADKAETENGNVEMLSEQLESMQLSCHGADKPNNPETGHVSGMERAKCGTESYETNKQRITEGEVISKKNDGRKTTGTEVHKQNITISDDSGDESCDSSDTEASCAEDNLSLRSRLLRKADSKNVKKQHDRAVSLPNFPDFSDSEGDEECDTGYRGYRCSESKINNKMKHDEGTLFDKGLQLHATTSSQSNQSFPVFTPEKSEVASKSEPTKHEFEESNVKIYNVSDFSHLSGININLTTPNMTRLKNFSPSLCQTLLESTPSSSSKLQKAALLGSILNSPLQVDAILNAFNKDEKHFSPITDFPKEPCSLEKSIGNHSNYSLNGTSIALGNFQIESSLLRSIIASGGITSTTDQSQTHLQNSDTPDSNRPQKAVGLSCDTPDEKCIVGKLSFDHVISPSVPPQTSMKSSCVRLSPSKHCKENSVFTQDGESFIDLTCDTPDCNQNYGIDNHSSSERDGELVRQTGNNTQSNMGPNTLDHVVSPILQSKSQVGTFSSPMHLPSDSAVDNFCSPCLPSRSTSLTGTDVNTGRCCTDSCNPCNKCQDWVKVKSQPDHRTIVRNHEYPTDMEYSASSNDKISSVITFTESFSYFDPACDETNSARTNDNDSVSCDINCTRMNSTSADDHSRHSNSTMMNSTYADDRSRHSNSTMMNSTYADDRSRHSNSTMMNSTSADDRSRHSNCTMMNSTSADDHSRHSNSTMMNSTSADDRSRHSNCTMMNSTSADDRSRHSNSTMMNSTSADDRSPVSLADRLRKKFKVTAMKGVLQEFTGK